MYPKSPLPVLQLLYQPRPLHVLDCCCFGVCLGGACRFHMVLTVKCSKFPSSESPVHYWCNPSRVWALQVSAMPSGDMSQDTAGSTQVLCQPAHGWWKNHPGGHFSHSIGPQGTVNRNWEFIKFSSFLLQPDNHFLPHESLQNPGVFSICEIASGNS